MKDGKIAVLAIVFAFVETIYALDATIPDVKIQTEDNKFTVFGVDSQASSIEAINEKSMILVSPIETNLDGCKPFPKNISKNAKGFIILVVRGGCFFADKLTFAQRAGASAILVANSLNSLFENNDASQAGYLSPNRPCAVNCDGNGQFCKSCPSSLCVNFTEGTNSSSTKHKQCCAQEHLIKMYFNESFIKQSKLIPAIYVGLQDGIKLRERLQKNPAMKVKISLRPRTLSVIPGTVLWLLAVCVVSFGSYYGAQNERARVRFVLLRAATPSRNEPLVDEDVEPELSQHVEDDEDESAKLVPDAADREEELSGDDDAAPVSEQPQKNPSQDQQYMTIGMVVGMVLFASGFLVVLYFLISASQMWIYGIIDGFFCLAGWTSCALVVTIPATAALLGQRDIVLCDHEQTGIVRVSLPLGLVLAIIPTAFWLAVRTESFGWLAQDFLATCLCFNIMNIIKVPSFRIALLLLAAMMFYDVFMTFVTPFILGGNSIMMVVATGNANANATARAESCTVEPAPQMAALFKIPYFDYRHGYAMLGLGDVVFPGFLLAFAARLDAVTRGGPLGRCCFPNPRLCDKARYDSANRNALRPGCGYSPLLWAGYGTGLGVAQIANYMGWTIAGVQGQPALLYLVPLTCIPLLLFSAARGELCDIWTERNPTRPHGSSMCCCGSEENSSPSREPDQTDDSIQNLEETAGE